MSMTNPTNHIEIITSVQRRRRWTASEKVRMVEETFEPGMTVSLVARQHGVAPNQLFTWRRLVAQGSLTAAGSGEEVVPASDYRALQNQVRELHRLLGKKTPEAKILKEALEHATGSKKTARRCRRRTIPDEDRGGSDRRLPLEFGGAPAGMSAEADRSAAIAGCPDQLVPHRHAYPSLAHSPQTPGGIQMRHGQCPFGPWKLEGQALPRRSIPPR